MSDYYPIPLDVNDTGENPKYEFYMDGYTLKCKRYGEEWRDFCGDNAVSNLFIFATELIDVLEELTEIVEGAIGSTDELDSFTLQPARQIIAKIKKGER